MILFTLFLGILANRPAENVGGKQLTVKEVILSRETRPQLQYYFWDSKGELTTEYFRPAEHIWQLPRSEDPNISYGTTVSRNEFAFTQGVIPSPNGTKLAVYKKDESAVSRFPLLDITTRTGSLDYIPYPMNGMPSERLELCICDTLGNVLTTLDVTDFTQERYLTNVSWSPDGNNIFVQVLDREQHNMHLNVYDSADGHYISTILTEHNDAWVEPLDPLYPINGTDAFIYRTDNRDGYRNLYKCTIDGKVERLTKVDADVDYIGNDGKWVYYYSYEISPADCHVFRIPVKGGKAKDLTPDYGSHTVWFNADFTQFIDKYSSYDNPGTILLKKADGTNLKTLSQASNPLSAYAQPEIEFGTVKSADGQFENNYRLIKPLNFDPDKKYPLLVYVYGGPHLQMVNNTWLGRMGLWEMLMAQKGYVVYVQDNRGTPNHGAAYEKSINRACGQAEMADQMVGIQKLIEQGYIDTKRIGVHGWSYGGFMTISLMTSYPEFFKAGVAGGPVIDWQWYEVMYGERYMDTPDTNPEGFNRTSLTDKASKLKGDLLICQGMIDDTVVSQHSMNFVNSCIENGIQLEYFPYPVSKHNMYGGARVHLYQKITDYFLEHL